MPERLPRLDGFAFPVFVSPGGEERGRRIAERMRRTVAWLDERVGLPAVPELYVVGPRDWPAVTSFPTYGMPHVGGGRVVVGQETGAFWTTVADAITPHLSPPARAQLTEVYGDPPDLSAFADLIVSHELGHVTHDDCDPAWDEPDAWWVKELTANLALQGYVSEVEPASLRTLETVFRVTWDAPGAHWPIRDLARMGEAAEGDGSNYVWLEFGLQVLTRRLWHTAGVTGLRQLVELLRGPRPGGEGVLAVLDGLDPEVARAIRAWPDFAA